MIMALVLATLQADLNLAFVPPIGLTWVGCANKIATAIDTFILTGTVNTTVTGTVVPPPPAVPYIIIGAGIGIVTSTTLPALQSSIVSAFTSPLWATVGPAIANAINAHIIACTVSTTITGALVGTGAGASGVAVVPTGIAVLISGIITAFTTPGIIWTAVAAQMALSIYTFLTTAIINTNDAGQTPFPWTGTGLGSIS